MSPKLDDKEKIKIVDKIDNLRVAQNNHLMIGKFEEAINVAEKMIKLAEKADLTSIVEEQREVIKNIKQKMVKKNKITLIKDTFEKLKKHFDKLIVNNKIVEAHKLVVEFKKKYAEISELTSISTIQDFFSKEKAIWDDFKGEQDKIKEKLEQLNKQFNKFLKESDLINLDDIRKKAKLLLADLFDDAIKKKWELHEEEYLDCKKKNELVDKVKNVIKESSKLKEQFLFEEAVSIIDSTIELIQNEDIPVQIKELKEKKEEIYAAEVKYNKLYLELANYKGKFKENHENKYLNAALSNCERVIYFSNLIGMKEIEKEYKQILEQINQEIERNKSSAVKERDELNKKAKEIKKLIKFDDNILPLIEEYNIKDLIGELSDKTNEKLEQIVSLLNEYRIEIKNKIINKVILTTTAQEVIEIEVPKEIQIFEGEKGEIIHEVRSGIKNRFDDTIEEALITDIIPYNFEICNIEFNGEPVKTPLNKTLIKDGIELNWKIQNIAPEEKIDIIYELRRRVSRTIIFILDGQLKIIKTHSNLTPLNIEGLYEINLFFNNSLGSELNGVVIEDVIPPYYLHYFEEPKDLMPKKTKDLEKGEILKWMIETMKSGTLNYRYKLLESYRFKEIKKEIESLDKEGLHCLNEGSLKEVLAKYKEIRNLLMSRIK